MLLVNDIEFIEQNSKRNVGRYDEISLYSGLRRNIHPHYYHLDDIWGRIEIILYPSF